MSANTKSGKHIPWDHPRLQRVRDWIQIQIVQKRFHPQLIGNFDQSWSLNMVPRRRVLQSRVHIEPARQRALRHQFQRALGLDFSEPQEGGAEARGSSEGLRQIQGGMSASVPVENYRIPHTVTTLSFIDGFLGRGFLTVRSDHCSEKSRAALNEDRPFQVHSAMVVEVRMPTPKHIIYIATH